MKTLLSPAPSHATASSFSFRYFALLILLLLPGKPLGAATVTLDGSQSFQTIDGFGVNLNHWNTNELAPVLDALVDQAGMTLFRIVMDHSDWESSNINSDPNVLNWSMNWAYYNGVFSTPDFQHLWDTMTYLNQKGITNGMSLSFMGVGPYWMLTSGTTYLLPGYEPHWAEMLTALLLYSRNTRHLQFTLVEPSNEPDQNSSLNKIRLTQDQDVTALHNLAQCLDANGLGDIRFVGPDLAFTSFPWMSAWLNDPVISAKLAHLGIHCYNDNFGGPSTGVYSFLQQSSHPEMNFWMTEYNEWCSNCEGGGYGNDSWSFARDSVYYLLNHLNNGAAGAMVFTGCDTWMAYLNNGLGDWSYWGLFAVDNIYATPKTFSPRKGFYTLSQVSKYVRPGARHIALSGYTSPFNLVAFYHPGSGQLTIVGVNPSGASTLSATLASLPPVSSLDLYYTSSSANLTSGGAVPVNNGSFSTVIPGDCVFTLVARPSISIQLTNLLDGATFSSPATVPLQAMASTTTGTITDVAFYAGTSKLGDALVPPYSLTWSNVPPGSYTLTAWATNSLGNSAASPALHVVVVGPPANVFVSPTNALVPPYGTQQFTVRVTDAGGTLVNPPPLISWAVDAGGNIDINGLFTAGGIPGGPFTVHATSGSVTGSASVSIATNGTPFLPLQPARSVPELTLLTVSNTAIGSPSATQLATNSFPFAYASRDALLADGWSFLATANGSPRNTEVTNPAAGAVISYNPAGPLSIPCDMGDLWSSANNSRNSLFRTLPTNWLSVQLAFSFSPSANYHQAQLVLYQDDDNYLEAGMDYNSYLGGRSFTWTVETGGAPVTFPFSTSAADSFLRLDRNAQNGLITGFCSLDGVNWTVLGATNLPLVNPRLAIWTGGVQPGASGSAPTFVLRRLTLVASNAVPRRLAYSLLNPPDGASIDTNGIITWQPAESQGPGTNVICTVATDNSSPPFSLSNSFTVVVQEVNTAPVLPPQNDRMLLGQQSLAVTNTAADADLPANSLSYQLLSAPPGASIDPNGLITWLPTTGQVPSTNLFTTAVTDFNPWAINAQMLSASNSFTVVVRPLPSFHILSVYASNNVVWLAWESEAGRSYRLQYKNTLEDTNWQEVPTDIVASGPTSTAAHPIDGQASRLYRVRLLP